jgi:ABC-type branched-subunit amino acid transport system ATPase component
LSYGQQKLLTLACCLAMEAGILLLDEPVAGVHPDMILKILGLLRELRAMKKLVVFIEHDIAAVREVADLVIVLDDGKVIAQGVPAEVLERREIMEAYVG